MCFYSKINSHKKEKERRLRGLEWDKQQQKLLKNFYEKRNKELDSGQFIEDSRKKGYVPGLWQYADGKTNKEDNID